MNRKLTPIVRNACRGSLAAALIALTAASSSAADRSRFADAENSDSSTSAGTSVHAELQKLFGKSGTPMPSMEMADLPYATTPQMNRVQKRDEQPAAEKKPKKGLFRRFFSRFRRNKAEEDTTELQPPEIRTAETPRAIRAPRPAGSGTARAVPAPHTRALPEQQRPQPRQSVARSTSPDVFRPVSQSKSQSQPKTETPSAASRRDIPRLDLTAQDEFENPFEDFGVDPDEDVSLDLDAVAKAPAASDEPQASPAAEEQTTAAAEPEANPFTGRSLSDDDEFENPFQQDSDAESEVASAASDAATSAVESSAVEAEANPFMQDESDSQTSEADPLADAIVDTDDKEDKEDSQVVRIVPRSVEPLPVATANQSASVKPEAAEAAAEDTTEQTSEAGTASLSSPAGSDDGNEWKSRSASGRSSRSVGSTTTAARSRRLASADRAPATRAPVERRQHDEDQQSTETGKSPKFGERTVSSASPAPKDNSPKDARLQQIRDRRHLNGFMGFCPVELRDSRALVDSSEAHKVTFGLQTYQFSSEEACQQFESNPARYAPAAGGSDVVALVNSGEQHAGSLEYAMWYRDRLYLFHSRETMGMFRADPSGFADQY